MSGSRTSIRRCTRSTSTGNRTDHDDFDPIRCEDGKLEGGCKVDCDAEQGALFCDGQYVDHGGNLEDCVASLEAWITANVDVSASGSAMGECMGGTCEGEAEGEASASCATVPGGAAGSGVALVGMMLAGAAIARRRRAMR